MRWLRDFIGSLLLGGVLSACTALGPIAPFRAPTHAPIVVMPTEPPVSTAMSTQPTSSPTEGTGPIVGTSMPSTQVLGHWPTLTPSPETSPTPAPGPKIITQEHHGQTMVYNIGDTFTLQLSAGYNWALDVNETIVAVAMPEASQPIWTLSAAATGQTPLTASGDPKCYPQCLMPSVAVSINLIIK